MAPKASKAKKPARFVIDCAVPAKDDILVPADLSEYLSTRIKVNGKAGALGDAVRVDADSNSVTVTGPSTFSKRYLKYLSKKYLAREQLRDFLRVVATNKNTYTFRYYTIGGEEE